MEALVNLQVTPDDKADKANKVITEEMVYDYAAFLLNLWHSGQKVNKINEKGKVSMNEK